MLDKAVRLAKPGGLIIYCTCSLQPEECERQVAKILKSGNVERLPVSPSEMPGLDGAITNDGDLRTHPAMDPGAPGGMDGFFAARLRRLE